MNKKENFIKLTEKYLNFLRNLSEEDVFRLETGEATIKFEIYSNKKNGKSNKKEALKLFSDTLSPETIITDLFQIQTREAGEKYIEEKCPTRLELEAVIRKLDIPLNKRDTMEKLKDKIIEGTIGFRLRSQAIQG